MYDVRRTPWIGGFLTLMLLAPQAAWAACSDRNGIGVCVDGTGLHYNGGPILATVGVIIGLVCAAYAIKRTRGTRRCRSRL